MNMQTLSLHLLDPALYNPRIDLQPGDAPYEALKRSIQSFGCVEPIVVNQRTMRVIGGHQRLKVLRDLGHEQADVVLVDLPPDREKALNVALNKISGDWDEHKLAQLLDELIKTPDLEIEVTGFDLHEAQELIAGILGDLSQGEDDFDLEQALADAARSVTQPGDLIELGSHRLLCGDCTSPGDVRRIMDGHRATLFATDPPYLVGYDGTNHPGKGANSRSASKNKNWSGSYGPAFKWDDPDANRELYEQFIAAARAEAIADNAAWYCWHASRRQAMVEDAWKKNGAFVHQQIVWAKDRPVLNRSWYTWQHEPCFFGWVRPHKPPRHTQEHLSTIWRVPTIAPGTQTEHPTSKPLELFAIPMQQHTRRGDVCYEPFAGSGSQLIAAENLGRRCFAIEISPQYCDVIVRRFMRTAGEQNIASAVADRYRPCQKEVAA